MKKSLIIILNFVIFFLLILHSNAQKVWALQDGYMLNGKEYNVQEFNYFDGNQFLVSRDFRMGVFYVKGQGYLARLNIDIYRQRLIIQYFNHSGIVSALSVPTENIDSIRIDQHKYIYNNEIVGGRLVEAIGSTSGTVFIYYYKRSEIETSFSSANYYFTEPLRVYYLFQDGNYLKFSTKRQLFNYFDKSTRKNLGKLFKQNNIKLKSATFYQITLIANYLEKKS